MGFFLALLVGAPLFPAAVKNQDRHRNGGSRKEVTRQADNGIKQVLLDHLQLNTPLPDDIALVNLNLRSVVDAKEELSKCLFDRILDRYVATEFWDECQNCPSR